MGKAFAGEKKRRISKMPVYLADVWCSLPQNNVSMFFKWNFVWLLMRVPIKLHSLQCYGFVYVSRRTKRVWKKKKHWMPNSSHYFLCRCPTISQSLYVCMFCYLYCSLSHRWNDNSERIQWNLIKIQKPPAWTMKMFNHENRKMFVWLLKKNNSVDFNACFWMYIILNKMSCCHFSSSTRTNQLKLAHSKIRLFCTFYVNPTFYVNFIDVE